MLHPLVSLLVAGVVSIPNTYLTLVHAIAVFVRFLTVAVLIALHTPIDGGVARWRVVIAVCITGTPATDTAQSQGCDHRELPQSAAVSTVGGVGALFV